MQNIIIEKLLLSKDIEEYIRVEIEYSSLEPNEYKKAMVKLGEKRFSKFAKMLNSSSLSFWQAHIVFNAFYYSFIQIDEVQEAISAISVFKNEDIFFNECSEETNGIKITLANASQI